MHSAVPIDPLKDRHRDVGRYAFAASAALVILVAVMPRAYHLGQRSLWLDEAIAANISRGTLAQTLILTRALHSAPIIHPFILCAVEKAAVSAVSVRLPSLIASLLAVILMLWMAASRLVDREIGVLAALMLSVSASQVRYAQEVREYSLSVLYATVLLYAFLLLAAKRRDRGRLAFFCLVLLIAPLIQYGLVLASAAALISLLLLGLLNGDIAAVIEEVLISSLFLGLGSLASFLLTLRFQWGEKAWYLQGDFPAAGSSIIHFVVSNTRRILSFLLPGRAIALIAVVAIGFLAWRQVKRRQVGPLEIAGATSVLVVLACALLRVYPFGPIRQCLFLAPGVCMLAAAGLIEVKNACGRRARIIVFVALVGVIVGSGALQIRSERPYAEIEDVQSVLSALRSRIAPTDQAYVYSGAVPAVDFYTQGRDTRLVYGDFHRESPTGYLQEIQADVGPATPRLWIIFSHVFGSEDQTILHDLASDWRIEPIISAKGAALYEAVRRRSTEGKIASAADAGVLEAIPSPSVPSLQPKNDSFRDWSLRNAGRPVQ